MTFWLVLLFDFILHIAAILTGAFCAEKLGGIYGLGAWVCLWYLMPDNRKPL